MYQSKDFKMWIEEDIFQAEVLSETFTLAMAEECIRVRREMTQCQTLPIFSDSRRVKDFEKDARQYLASDENTKYVSAGAILISSQLQKIIGNFFLFINRPNVPSKLFNEKNEAIAWLNEYKF
jgi:hypothetical protein